MNDKASTNDSIHLDLLRELVQEKEAELLTELLNAKRKRVQMINEAKKNSKILYKERREKLETKIKTREEQLQTRMNDIMKQLDKKEQEYLEQMEESWIQHKVEALNKCLKRILP